MRITESQLRRVIRKIVSEQAGYSAGKEPKLQSPPKGGGYRMFDTLQDAKQDLYGAPVSRVEYYQDPETGKYWYWAEFDTWGT